MKLYEYEYKCTNPYCDNKEPHNLHFEDQDMVICSECNSDMIIVTVYVTNINIPPGLYE